MVVPVLRNYFSLDKARLAQNSFHLFPIFWGDSYNLMKACKTWRKNLDFNKLSRSSRQEVFCKKDVLRNFAKFTGKHLCQSFFFNKVAGLRLAALLKKKLWHRCFRVNFAKFLRTSILTEHLCWLLLIIYKSIYTFSEYSSCIDLIFTSQSSPVPLWCSMLTLDLKIHYIPPYKHEM